MDRVSDDQRRARLGIRHRLAQPAASLDAAVRSVIGLHASDPTSVYLSARARVDGFTSPDLERSLYDDRSLVRLWGMRRTLFVATRDLAAIMRSASPDAFGRSERARFERMLADQGTATDPGAWIDDVAAKVLAELAAREEATANELRGAIPELGETLTFGEGKTWGGTVGVSTRVLFLLAAEGRIMRGRPRGTWISSQYRWTLTDAWLGSPLADLDPFEARAQLVRQWLSRFGPGTTTDIKWWTGWKMTDTRTALDAVDAVEVELSHGPGWLLPDDLDSVEIPDEWAALLPSLDPTVMGWKERDWYLGEHYPTLFDRNGNAGPTVWWNGQIVGGWAQRDDGEIAIRLVRDLPTPAAETINAEADRLYGWFGPIRVTPRFRAPLERELSS
ncbi:MAG: winged helix DNA-binding domain-containing protein [Acidimicrobiia bacterium]